MDTKVKVVELDIDDVLPNRFQPRIKFNEDSIDELADSIKDHGVIQPIVVRRLGSKYEIIAGERRYKACVKIGKSTIPAIITDLNDKDSAEVALIENVQRKNLTPIEEAVSYRKILDMGYLTQESLANKLGKKQSTIANKLRLLNLTDEVQEALLQDKISERHARSLLRLSNRKDQIDMLDRILAERMPVRKLDEEILKILNKSQNKSTATSLDDIINNLQSKTQKENKKENFMNNDMFGKINIPSEPIIDNTKSNNTNFNNINYMQSVNDDQISQPNNNNNQARFYNSSDISLDNQSEELSTNNFENLFNNNEKNNNNSSRSNRFHNMFMPINSDENFVDDLEKKSIDMNVLINQDKKVNSFDQIDIPNNLMSIEKTRLNDQAANTESNQSVNQQNNSRVNRLYSNNTTQSQPIFNANQEFSNDKTNTVEDKDMNNEISDFEILDFNEDTISFDDLQKEPINKVYNNYTYRNVEEIPVTKPETKNESLYMVRDLKTAINTVRNSIQTVEKYGFKVDSDEIDFEDKYQIIINIEKR